MHINELYELCRNGDRTSEKLLLMKLRESLSHILEHKVRNRQDVEDIVQEVLLTVAGKYKEIVIERSFAAWVYKIMKNELGHYYRQKRKDRLKNEKIREKSNINNILEVNPTLAKNLITCLEKMHSVNKRYARILNLVYQGYGTEEICKKLNISRNNVHVITSRARSLLKYCLEHGSIK